MQRGANRHGRCTLVATLVAAMMLLGSTPASASTGTRPSSAPVVDCTAVASSCPELTVVGDAPATLADGQASPARGYADPALRKDPTSTRIWMAYSWPHTSIGPSGRAVTVDTHLAHSDDGGATWTFDRALWTTASETDPVTGVPSFENNEVVSLEAVASHGTVTWYSVRQRYDTAGSANLDLRTFALHVAAASSPTELANVDEQVLGGGRTSPAVSTDANLSVLSRKLTSCVFQDPSLHAQHGWLYLAAQCSLYTTAGEDFAHEFIAVFKTRPVGDVKTWTWRYVGAFGTHADAVELGGQHLQQTDLERGRHGKLLAIVSPGTQGSGVLGAHTGCGALVMRSLDPPKLARTNGKLDIAAQVRSSDSLPDGPGACGYDHASTTGIVIMRRELGRGELLGSLRASGLRP
jgi:hypothetical protein